MLKLANKSLLPIALPIGFNIVVWCNGFNYDERGPEAATTAAMTMLMVLLGIALQKLSSDDM